MSQHEDYTAPPGFRVSGAGGTKLAPVLIDSAAHASEGDVITRVGSGYAPQASSGGGSVLAYTHSCDGIEAALAIPFPAEGDHATVLLLAPAPPAPRRLRLGADGTSTVIWALDGGAVTLFKMEWPWFRGAEVGFIRGADNFSNGASGAIIPSQEENYLLASFNLCWTDGDGVLTPFPSGTKVEVWVQ